MRRLLLIRHAKSSWKYPELDDHERPLTKRGERDVIIMARQLGVREQQLDAIYTSTARRALDYAQQISDVTGTRLVADSCFYSFEVDALMRMLRSLPSATQNVAVVAHNPAITLTVNRLTNLRLNNVPTAAIVALSCDTPDWHGLTEGLCQLDYFDYPKMFLPPGTT